jgi:hypothetical protein
LVLAAATTSGEGPGTAKVDPPIRDLGIKAMPELPQLLKSAAARVMETRETSLKNMRQGIKGWDRGSRDLLTSTQ